MSESEDDASAGSDIELQSALPKLTKKKIPKSPSEEILIKNKEAKRMTTKIMINQALADLKQRKGVSLYAIKKYIEDKYKVDVKKINHHIKNQIKTGLESGTILQTKGVGVAGSFKLAVVKPPKREKKVSDKPKKSMEKGAKTKSESSKEPKKQKTKKEEQGTKKVANKKETMTKTEKGKKTMAKEKKEGEKLPKIKFKGKGLQTPAKKRAAMMKRKSIGSIIKPPKMKPKAK